MSDEPQIEQEADECVIETDDRTINGVEDVIDPRKTVEVN